MNIFKTTTLTWWQVSLLKWAVFLIGIAVGATWPELFAKYTVIFIVIGLVLSLYLFKVWVSNK
ncbi:MAG: hypothetical protein AAB618_03315 [Patescibacteria group bacterium]